MISIYSKSGLRTTEDGELSVCELRGLSTDEKPTNVDNGSTFIEIDTGKIYMYDLEHEQWKEI